MKHVVLFNFSFEATGTNTVTKSTTIKSLQYAKVNKARKNLDEQNAPVVPVKRAVAEADLKPLSKDLCKDLCKDLSKDLSKDLTLEEILSLETDREVKQITKLFQYFLFISVLEEFSNRLRRVSDGW